MRRLSIFPLGFTRITSMSPQNSHRIWRQAPHGGVRLLVSAATAIRRNLRAPSEIALKTATRGVLYITSRVDATGFVLQRGADQEVRVGGVRVHPRYQRGDS
jgi:hypothetical protein